MRAAFGVLVRTQVSRGRLAAIAGLGLLVVLVGVAVRTSEHSSTNDAVDALNGAGLALFVPVTALVFGTAVLGEMVDDATFVYLWARPLRRVSLAVAAIGASLAITLPCVLVPVALTAIVLEADAGLMAGALVASTLSAVAHTAVFVGIGVRVPRALVWGLVYVAVWEGAVASVGAGVARTSLRLYANSLMHELADAGPVDAGVGAATAVGVLVAVAAVGVAVTTGILRRADVA